MTDDFKKGFNMGFSVKTKWTEPQKEVVSQPDILANNQGCMIYIPIKNMEKVEKISVKCRKDADGNSIHGIEIEDFLQFLERIMSYSSIKNYTRDTGYYDKDKRYVGLKITAPNGAKVILFSQIQTEYGTNKEYVNSTLMNVTIGKDITNVSIYTNYNCSLEYDKDNQCYNAYICYCPMMPLPYISVYNCVTKTDGEKITEVAGRIIQYIENDYFYGFSAAEQSTSNSYRDLGQTPKLTLNANAKTLSVVYKTQKDNNIIITNKYIKAVLNIDYISRKLLNECGYFYPIIDGVEMSKGFYFLTTQSESGYMSSIFFLVDISNNKVYACIQLFHNLSINSGEFLILGEAPFEFSTDLLL